ncbi:uncharacterized protein LOC134701531 [Mytilus trossulus]|uniref:uncharacterized protein LOC134701531 n=1 Tax=Mytilus trossulus TaxID=6551 RepID=UPI0030061D78
MALSKSIQKAQIPLPCELCEIETKIKWKCTDCNLLMCDKCKNKVHSKFKKAKEHKIITIKEVGLHGDDSGPKLDFSDIQCKDHSGQVCCLFCKSCDHLVCPTGVTKTHKTHELVEIENVFRMRMELLKKRKEKLKQQHDDLKKDEKKLNALKETNKLSFDQTQKDILQEKQIWKEAGDKYAEELRSEINKQWRRKEEAIETESTKVKKIEQYLNNKIQLIEDTRCFKDVKKFFEDTKSLEDVKKMPKINLNQSQLQRFEPGQIVQSYFGSIQEENHKDKMIRIEAIREYITELPIVNQILQSSENTFWIHSSVYPKTIQKVTLEPDSSLKVLLEVKDYAYCTALTRNGDLLVSDLTSNLKILNENTKKLTISKYNFQSYIVKSIHINRENQLIVGAVKKLPIDYSVSGEGVVMVMDMYGNHQVKYEFDKNNEPLLTNPMHITTTKNGNIFIIDRTTGDFRGRVVTLEKGTVVNIYSGHADINSKNHPFKPQTIEATPNDNIIVSDTFNNTLHILDNCGHLLFYCNTMEAGVMGPYSMAFIEPGKLLIGCATTLISANNPNAKIYEVDIPKDI